MIELDLLDGIMPSVMVIISDDDDDDDTVWSSTSHSRQARPR
jgi:hypothetical protein